MTAERYSRTAMMLHWALALLLAFQLSLGWRLEDMPRGPGLFSAYQLHKSVGISILLLTLVRVAIRFLHKRPPLPVDSRWAQMLAKLTHFGLYAVMLGGPLTGWALVSTAKIKVPTLVFNILPWPHLPISDAWHDLAEAGHAVLALLGVLLFFMHVAGALRHQFVKGEALLPRMVPFASRHAALAVVGALAAMFSALTLAKFWGFAAPPISVATSTTPPLQAETSTNIAPVSPEAKLVAETKAEDKAKLEDAKLADPAKAKQELAAKPDQRAPDTKAEVTKAEPPQQPIPLSDWQIAPGGRLGFTASWSGLPIEGRFNSWQAAIKFSPNALDKTNIRITISLATADTQDSQRDSNLKSDQFFNTSVFPQAVYTATNARSLGGDRYASDGTLNLHGISRPVTINYTLKFAPDGTLRVSGGTRLDRLAFGVGSGEYAKTDEIAGLVPVNFSFQAMRK